MYIRISHQTGWWLHYLASSVHLDFLCPPLIPKMKLEQAIHPHQDYVDKARTVDQQYGETAPSGYLIRRGWLVFGAFSEASLAVLRLIDQLTTSDSGWHAPAWEERFGEEGERYKVVIHIDSPWGPGARNCCCG